MKKLKTITIIIPAYNEEESLPYLIERIKKLIDSINKYNFEILFINDGSKDNTKKETDYSVSFFT